MASDEINADPGAEAMSLPAPAPKSIPLPTVGTIDLLSAVLSGRKAETVQAYRTDYEDFARFKGAIADCLEGVEGKHKRSIQSLLTLNFQTFEEPQLLAG